MRGTERKDFLRNKTKLLIQSVRKIDKKWYPAIGLGTVAVLAAIVVVIFSVTDGLRLSGNQGSQSANAGAGKEQKTMYGQGGAAGGGDVSYTPEELSKALEDLKGAFAGNAGGKGKIHFKNPFANFKINITEGTKKTTSAAYDGSTKKNSSNGGDAQHGTTQKGTEPSKSTTTTSPADTTQSTAPPQTEAEPEEPATQSAGE